MWSALHVSIKGDNAGKHWVYEVVELSGVLVQNQNLLGIQWY
jgi:hypothetical protein